MKKFLLSFIMFSFLSVVSYAQHVGPGVPPKNIQGNIASPVLGVGYSFLQAEYNDIEVEQSQAYAHLGAAFGDASTPNYEIFLRLGASTFEDDDNFDGDMELMYAAGIKGEFYQGYYVGWGGVLQGQFVENYEDSIMVGGQKVDVQLKDNWEVELALPVHVNTKVGLVYLGPVLYSATSDVISKDNPQREGDLDEDRNLGAVGGIAFRSDRISFEVEAKYRSDFSVGAFASFVF